MFSLESVSGQYFGLREVKLCNVLLVKVYSNAIVILAKSELNRPSLNVGCFQAEISLFFLFSFLFKNIMRACLESEYTNWIIYAVFDKVIEINWRGNDDSLFW